MDDLISRRAAIEAIIAETYMDGAYGYADCKTLMDALENLPSAQPEGMTRADRIRAMPDEELAAFFEDIAPHDEWTFWLDGKTWLDWLKSPAEKVNSET